MVTQADMIQRCRSRLDEPEETRWKNTEIRRWINEGVREVARLTETVQATTTISVSANDGTYTLDSTTLRIYRVEFYESASGTRWPLEYRDFNTMDEVWATAQVTSRGTPMYFTLWGTGPAIGITLYPTPSAAGTLNIFYYKTPTDLAIDGSDDTDSLEVVNGWEDLVTDYVEYNALRKDRDGRWVEAKGLFDQHLEQMIAQTRRLSDQAGEWGGGYFAGVPAWLANPDGWY